MYPDFALNMREKVSKEDFEIYEKMVKETGEIKDSKTYEGTAWINEENSTIEIKEGSLAKNTYVGYKYDSIDTSAKEGDKVASGTESKTGI